MFLFYEKFVIHDLTTFVLKNLRQLFDKYAVVRTEHDALVKIMTKIFSNFMAFSENPNFNNNIFAIVQSTVSDFVTEKETYAPFVQPSKFLRSNGFVENTL